MSRYIRVGADRELHRIAEPGILSLRASADEEVARYGFVNDFGVFVHARGVEPNISALFGEAGDVLGRSPKRLAIELPSLQQLLEADIGSKEFQHVLSVMLQLQFKNRIEKMAEVLDLKPKRLEKYISHKFFPETYNEVVRIAHKLGISAERLGYAWMAALTDNFSDITKGKREITPIMRAQILAAAAGLRLSENPPSFKENQLFCWTIELAKSALRAGFEEPVVLAVSSDLISNFMCSASGLETFAERYLVAQGLHQDAALLYRVALAMHGQRGNEEEANRMALKGYAALGQMPDFPSLGSTEQSMLDAFSSQLWPSGELPGDVMFSFGEIAVCGAGMCAKPFVPPPVKLV